jgi:F0F1-type ATP synthase epsilon subunit
VLVGEAHEPGDLDSSDLRAKLEDAEKRLAESESGSAAYIRAETDKARAEAFLTVAGN